MILITGMGNGGIDCMYLQNLSPIATDLVYFKALASARVFS